MTGNARSGPAICETIHNQVGNFHAAWGKIREEEVRSQKPEVRSQKSEARSQKSEVRSQKPEVRSVDSEI
ncbi:MAG: hypothetical protein ACKV2V_16950, partial [Blastocatellia bacterium]